MKTSVVSRKRRKRTVAHPAGALTLAVSLSLAVSPVLYGNGTIVSSGTLVVDANSPINTPTADINVLGNASLVIQNGGTATVNNTFLQSGTAVVIGASSSLTGNGIMEVGSGGTATLTGSNGATISTQQALVGTLAGDHGTINVTGTGTQLNVSQTLDVGETGHGILNIQNGAMVNSGSATQTASAIGKATNSNGTVNVDGAGSMWNHSSALNIGDSGFGTLNITNGGTVQTGQTILGNANNGFGSVVVTGEGSKWTTSTTLYIGNNGEGDLNVAQNGIVQVDGTNGAGKGTIVLGNANGFGQIDIGGGVESDPVAPGTIQASQITSSIAGGESASINFNHTSDNYQFAPQITGNIFVFNETGITYLTGSNSYTAGTEVDGGAIGISQDANLGAAGTSVYLSDGTIIASGTFTLTHTLTFDANDSTFQVNAGGDITEIGLIDGSGTLNKTGDGKLTLTGTNQYSNGTVISAGTLSVSDSANLGDPSSNVAIGAATLQTTGTFTFTNSVTLNSADSSWDVDGNGNVTASGLIDGTGTLHKTGTGILHLTGSNIYGGGTVIRGGELGILDAQNLGKSSTITLDSGSLRFDQSMILNASIQLTGSNGGFDTAGNNATLTGSIDGAGGFSKFGLGTLTLGGSNTFAYRGETLVSQGTLTFANANLLPNGTTLDVFRGATFDLNNTSQTAGSLIGNGNVHIGHGALTIAGNGMPLDTFAGSISGNGKFIKADTGILNLTGNSPFTGTTFVENGDLRVNGSIAGNIVVNTGYLGGDGFIGGSVYNRFGVLSPGNSPGVITIGGNYNQSANGSLLLQLASPTVYDRVVVGGHANLKGGLRVTLLNGFQPTQGETFNVLTAANGVTGQFSNVYKVRPTALLEMSVIYDPNDVNLYFGQLTLEDVITSLHFPHPLTPNELAVAHAIDKILYNPRVGSLISYLDQVSIDNLRRQLDLMSPEDLAVIFESGFAADQIQAVNLQQRLEDIRNGSTGFSASGLSISDSHGMWNFDGQPFTGSTDDLPVIGEKSILAAKQMLAPRIGGDQRWSFFAMGSGDFGDADTTSIARGANFTTGGITIGADYRFNPNFAAGIAGGYLNTSADISGQGRVDTNGGKGSVYATWFDDGFYVNGIAGGGYNSYDTKRSTIGGFAFGDTSGGDFNALLGGGYDHHAGALTFGPTASLQYTYVGLDSFTENGSLSPLHYDSQNQNSLKSLLGAKASYTWKIGHLIITPEVQAQWQHEYMDSTVAVESSFAAGGPFIVHGPAIGRDSLLIDAGATIQLNNAWSFYSFYTGDLARTNYSQNSVNGGFRVEF